MRGGCIALLLLALTTSARAEDVYVNGYSRSNGTYVDPYYRSGPNDTKTDNYSYGGNSNPYTGRSSSTDGYSNVSPSGSLQGVYGSGQRGSNPTIIQDNSLPPAGFGGSGQRR